MNASRELQQVEASLCFPIRNFGSPAQEVLLAEKRKVLNIGTLNGFGGKFDPDLDNDIWDTNARELKEESGLIVVRTRKVAEVLFYYHATNLPFETMLVSVFLVTEWTGSPISTEEMKDPKWYRTRDIDYSKLSPGDQLWLPRVFAGECLKGTLRWFHGSGITKPIGNFGEVDSEEFSRKGI